MPRSVRKSLASEVDHYAEKFGEGKVLFGDRVGLMFIDGVPFDFGGLTQRQIDDVIQRTVDAEREYARELEAVDISKAGTGDADPGDRTIDAPMSSDDDVRSPTDVVLHDEPGDFGDSTPWDELSPDGTGPIESGPTGLEEPPPPQPGRW